MRKWSLLAFSLLLTLSCWAKTVQSARGLATFDVPSNLQQYGTSWGMHPGLVIECREQFAPKGELKQLIWELAPPTPARKRLKDDDTEVDGKEAKAIAVEAGSTYTRYLFVRYGNYNMAWSVMCMGASHEEVDTHFDQLVSTIHFAADATLNPGEGEGAHDVRDPSGSLEISLPGKFGPRGPHKFGDGQMMVILTAMRKADENLQRDFAFKYAPPGFKSYMRRNLVEMGDHKGALILSTSDDGKLENQMVMLTKDGRAVVLSFMGPVEMRGQISLLREQVAGQARWVR